MRPIDLPPRELLKIIAYLATLKAQSAAADKSRTPRLAIQVSSERLQGAGSRTDEWLTYSGSYNGTRFHDTRRDHAGECRPVAGPVDQTIRHSRFEHGSDTADSRRRDFMVSEAGTFWPWT